MFKFLEMRWKDKGLCIECYQALSEFDLLSISLWM